MRILIHGLNFSPELTGIGKYTGELAQFLAFSGFDVRVVTSYPYYPQWKISNGYPSWRYSIESNSGLLIIRCPLYVPCSPSTPARMLHLMSFAMSSGLALITQIPWKPDVVLSIAPAILAAPFSLLGARLARSKAWLHIQDFEIYAAQSLGMLSGAKPLRRLLDKMQERLIRAFDRTSTISRSMLGHLLAMGVHPTQVELLPNWVDTKTIRPSAEREAFRAKMGIPDDKIVVLYSGNMGQKQGLEVIIEAAQILSPHKSYLFVLCGDGAARPELECLAKGLHNVRFLDVQPLDTLNALLNVADIHVLPQRENVAGLVMPSKLAGMLASGRPVIATAHPRTELGEIASQVGIIVPPANADSLADAIRKLSIDPQRRQELGQRGREYAIEHWDKERVLSRFVMRLYDLHGK